MPVLTILSLEKAASDGLLGLAYGGAFLSSAWASLSSPLGYEAFVNVSATCLEIH